MSGMTILQDHFELALRVRGKNQESEVRSQESEQASRASGVPFWLLASDFLFLNAKTCQQVA